MVDDEQVSWTTRRVPIQIPMHQVMSFCFFSLVLLLPPALFASWAAKPLLVPRKRTYKSVAQVRDLLNPSHITLESLLLARAAPNRRLLQAFGLTNTFVSSDVKVHKAFTTSAKALIAAGSPGEKEAAWRAVASSAEATVRKFLPVNHDDVVAFSTFVQCVTFAVVLSTLFHTDLDAIRYEDVVYVTQAINRRWEDSKANNAAAMLKEDGNSSYSLRRMNALIEQWVVDLERFPNPLNFILPAYETMWRVVAVTMAYVYRCPNNTLRDAAIRFAREPTEERFEMFGGKEGEGSSMQAVILEVLRLHPPTRHIARATTTESAASGNAGSWFPRWWNALVRPEIEIADIEAVHLSKNEYGEDTDVFDPMRFHPSRREGKGRPELYAFGYGKLRCVAAAWAPMAAGVMAAKVIEQLEEAGRTVTVGRKIGGRSGWVGWNVARRVEKGALE